LTFDRKIHYDFTASPHTVFRDLAKLHRLLLVQLSCFFSFNLEKNWRYRKLLS